MASNEKNNDSQPQVKHQRPFLLSVLLLALFVYSGLMSLLFLLALIYTHWLTDVVNDYLGNTEVQQQGVLLLSVAGFILHLVSLTGIIFMLRMKRIGFYLFVTAVLLIIVLPFFFGYGSIYSAIIFLLTIIFLGFFYQKLR